MPDRSHRSDTQRIDDLERMVNRLLGRAVDTPIRQTDISGTEDIPYGGTSSFQPVAVDLNLAAGAGNVSTNPKFLAPVMGNLIGENLTKEGAYLAGVIAALSVTGTRASLWNVAACLGILMDGSINADAIVLAVIDGSDPSTVTTARAAFGVAMNNNAAGSGVEYGVDLKDAGRGALFSDPGVGLAFTITKALWRSPSDVVEMEGAGVPVDGTTGDNFAGPGSRYTDITNANLYIQTSAITTPVWKLVTRAA